MSTLNTARIKAAVSATSKGEILLELAELAVRSLAGLDETQILELLWEREKLASTAKGNGVAIPHVVMDGVTQVELFFARSAAGVGFEALDGRSVHYFFLLIAPENAGKSYLPWLGRITRFSGLPVVRTRLMQAADAVELQEILAEM